jgi:SAM-dependent methyltransferase
MIDCSVNYGRHVIDGYLRQSLPFRSVLGIGAGQGYNPLAAKHLAADASLSAEETCPGVVRLLRDNGIGVKTAGLEREQLPFQNRSGDIVMANQVLEHMKGTFWIFHEISRMLRSRGRVIIGVPTRVSFHNWILLFFGRQPTQVKTGSAHVRGFIKRDLPGFLEAVFPGGYWLAASGGSNFCPFLLFPARLLADLFLGTKGPETNFYLGER